MPWPGLSSRDALGLERGGRLGGWMYANDDELGLSIS